MGPLVWIMISREINDRSKGFLPLILILLVLNTLKAGFSPSISPGVPCSKPSFVQIEGDVKSPGVYAFCHNASLQALIESAGGPIPSIALPEAYKDITMTSGLRVVIEREGDRCEFFQKEMSAFYKRTLGMPISLNQESEEGLTAIPGIGPVLARAIVRERSKRGGFKSLDDLTSIHGIGDHLYEKIRPFIKL